MTEREELEARRDTLQKVLEEVRSEVAARSGELSKTLSALTERRDQLLALVTAAEAGLSDAEDEATEVDEDWQVSRREAAAALAHLEELRRANRRG